MSHYTKLALKMSSEKIIKKALQRVGLKFEVGEFTISEYGRSEACQIRLDKSVGLAKQADGTYAMIGDFYHATTQSLRKYYKQNAEFTQLLGTSYAVEEVKDKLSMQNFYCSENQEATVGKNGKIRMVFTNPGV